MTARITCAGWMLKVRRRPGDCGGQGWPPGDPVTRIEVGGHNEDDDGRVLLEIHTDEAVRDLIEKLKAVLP
jgi:hypothetical protein